MLAHHFSKAEDWARALDYLVKAAEKPPRLRPPPGGGLYAEALAAAGRLADRVPAATLIAIHRARADLLFGLGEFVRSREEAEQLVALARRVQDRPAEADALVQVAIAFQWLEDFPAAHERARNAIEIAETVGRRGRWEEDSTLEAI